MSQRTPANPQPSHPGATVIAPPAESARRYRTPQRDRYDLVVLGGGSAGLSAATLGTVLGAQVALIDREKLGGECLYTGCVPSKALLHVARVAHQARTAASLGLSIQVGPVDLAAVAQHVQEVIGEVYVESDAVEHYIERGIDVIFGEAHFTDANTLSINGQAITAKAFVIATGSHPTVPAIPGLVEAGYLTNETVFSAQHLPPRLTVLGGGPIGVELGQAFARLGSQVTIIQRPDRILPKDEPEASQVLLQRLVAEGVTVHTHTELLGVTQRDGAKIAHVRSTSGETSGETFEVAGEELLVAIGRTPNVDGLGLEAAGVTCDPRKGVRVDEYYRTSNARIFAAGDVIGGYLFTHAAALQARVAARNALVPVRAKRDERIMPWATFTEPEVAHVGLTEAEARAAHGNDVVVVSQPFSGVDRAITDDATDGFVKLVAKRDGKLLGGEIVGAAAGEFINELALALQANLSLNDLAATTHVYPTMALAVQQAAGEFTLARTASSRAVKLLRLFS
ncbi:MAG: FAD-dependent oxidoreductase [Ktedonobacterales bacterium]